MFSVKCVLATCSRHFSATSNLYRQKIPYKQSYEWLLDVHKSRSRARNPWIPREPPTFCQIGGTVQRLPEMQVELMVPSDLESCDMKPYVAWTADIIEEPTLDAESLFAKRYADRIVKLHEEGKPDEIIISGL